MPYIPEFRRHELAMESKPEPENQGELNYLITLLLIRYLEYKELRYATINDILGALDAAGKEFYLRVVVPYENAKCLHHGDVYPKQFLG